MEFLENVLKPEVIYENAGCPIDLPSLEAKLYGVWLEEATLDIVCRHLGQKYVEYHKHGLYHINKLRDGILFKFYCMAVNLENTILKYGLKYADIVSKPPKNLRGFISQCVDFINLLGNYFAGAIALHGFDIAFTAVMAIDRDLTGMDYDHVYRYAKQQLQGFFYEVNRKRRLGSQSKVFSNITLTFAVPKLHNEKFRYDNKEIRIGDLYDKYPIFLRAFLEVLLEGDAHGAPFTFPVITVPLTREFLRMLEEWGLSKLFWRVVAERGSFYFLNGFRYDVYGMFTMCCRLFNPYASAYGLYCMPTASGSEMFITLNLPRCAYLAKLDEDKALDHVQDAVKYMVDILLFFRNLHRRLLGLKVNGEPVWRFFYDYMMNGLSTIDLILKNWCLTVAYAGIAEYVSAIIGDARLWKHEVDLDGNSMIREVARVYNKLLNHMLNLLREYSEKHSVKFTLEQAPAESSSYRFARLDCEMYPQYRQYIPHSCDPYTGSEEPYYTSQLTPPYTSWRLQAQVEVESMFQKKHTGGVVKHFFINKEVPWQNVAKLITAIAETGIVYFNYTPTQSICPRCGYRTVKLLWECPRCGHSMEIYSRVVGYYTPIRHWNPGRRAEFTERISIF